MIDPYELYGASAINEQYVGLFMFSEYANHMTCWRSKILKRFNVWAWRKMITP